MACQSIRPQATMNRMPASAASGRKAASGAASTARPSRNGADSAAASGVRAPAAKLTPLRLNEPLDG